MDTVTTHGLDVTSELDLYREDIYRTPRALHAANVRGQATAYVWGRQDAGESPRDTGESTKFGTIYALADYISDGYPGNLQGAHQEWVATGRLVVRIPNRGAHVEIVGQEDSKVLVRLIPWAGFEQYWPGNIRKPNRVCMVKHNVA